MICVKCSGSIPDGSLFCNLCGKRQVEQVRNTRKRGNGEGTVYKRGNVWQCAVVMGYKGDGNPIRRTKSGFKTKKEALAYIPTLRDSTVSERVKLRTLRHYYDSYEKTEIPKLGKSKQTAYRIAWNKLDMIKDTPVHLLNVVRVRDAVADVAPTYYTAKDVKTVLSRLFALAIADQQIQVNLADFIVLPPLKETEQVPWSNEELGTIWTAYDEEDPIAAYLLLMIYTGMMPGEVMKCTRGMVKMDEKVIVGSGLKTEVRKNASIVLPDLILPVIERIFTYVAEGDDQKILFLDKTTFYEEYHIFTEKWKIRDLPMYSCRHTTATALAVGTSVSPAIIQKIMRHARFTTTQRYIHPNVSDALDGVNKLTRTIPES